MIKIGQQEVYDFLCKNKGRWFTSREISKQLGVSIGSVTMSLKKLRKTNIIKYINTGVRNTYKYAVEPKKSSVSVKREAKAKAKKAKKIKSKKPLKKTKKRKR